MPTTNEKKRRDDDSNASSRVKVHIRLKKCIEKESASYNIFADGSQLHIPNHEGRLELDRWYKFDHIYSSIASNLEVYRFSAYDLVESALKGINTAIFAYGQTGSGKTHTLMSKDGVTAHMVSHLFNRIWKSKEDYKVTCSYFQIYNEHIYDLLNPQNTSECIVREGSDGEVYAENVTNIACVTPMDVYELINIGRKSLIIAETKMNRLSCRAHTVCQLDIERRKKLSHEKKRCMQETYTDMDATTQDIQSEQEKKSRIDFTTVPFNKSEIRKRHSIAVTKINECKKSPRIPKRSPSVQHTRIPVGLHRERSNSMRSRNRRKSPSPSLSDNLALPKSSGARRASGESSIEEKSKEDQLTMDDSIGSDGVKKLHDLYQSNISTSDTDTESIPFESENSFTFSEGCSDDYDSYYHEENEDTTDESIQIDEKETSIENHHAISSSSQETKVRRSKMSIVDLAGSERLTETNVDCERLKEAQNINLSLLELGNVVAALATGKKKHIPYRNSILTRLLKDSLGGNCKTKFLLCISTRHVDANETKCTLEFGQKLTKIYNNPTLNLDVDYQRKYEQLLRQLQNNEEIHEKRKHELIQRISIEEEEIRKQEETKCEHASILNSLEVKLDQVTSEHDEKAQKLSSLRETLLEQENLMKQKEAEILKLQHENEALFEQIRSSYSSETLSTLDAISFSSPDLTLDDDCCDSPVLNSSVSNGDINQDPTKGRTNTLKAFHSNDPISPITNSNVSKNKTPNYKLDSSIAIKSQNINNDDSIIVPNDNHNYNGLMETSGITSSMECHASSASYLTDDVTDNDIISMNSPTLFKALSEVIKDIPHNELYETAELQNTYPSELSTNEKNTSSGNIIDSDIELHVDVPFVVNYATDIDIEERILVDTTAAEVELNTPNIDVGDYNAKMTDQIKNNDLVTNHKVDKVDGDDAQSDSNNIVKDNIVPENVTKSKVKIIDDVKVYNSPIGTTPLDSKLNGKDVEVDLLDDAIGNEESNCEMPLVPLVDAITDDEIVSENEQLTADEMDVDTVDDFFDILEKDENENKNENTIKTEKDSAAFSENKSEECTNDKNNSEVVSELLIKESIENEQQECQGTELDKPNSDAIKGDILLNDIEANESEISDSVSTLTEISIQNHENSCTIDSLSEPSIQEENKKYDEMTIENVAAIERNNFEMHVPGGVVPCFKRHSDIIDSRGSSSLDYLNSSSQDSFPFTDVSDGSTIETADSITHTDDDYVIDLYTPTPIETCDIATNTSDDEISTDVLFAEQRSPNAIKRLSNPIVVTFVQTPKLGRKSANSNGRSGKNARRMVSSGTNTPVWNWWSPIDSIKSKDNKSESTTELETDFMTSQFENADTLRAAVLVELTRIQRLIEQARDPLEDLVTEFEMIGSIEGSRTSLNAEDPEPIINDVLFSVMNEVLNVVPNLISSNSSQSETKTDTTSRKKDFNNMRAPSVSSSDKTENHLDILKDYLEERKRLLQEEIRYILDEVNLNSDENNNNNNEMKNEKKDRQSVRSEGSLADLKLIETLIYHVASGRSPKLESVTTYNDLLDTVLSLHAVTSCLITTSRWPRALFEIKIPPTQTEQNQANSDINGSPRDCTSLDGMRNEEKKPKQRKSFLNKFLCMPTKSSKVKK